MLRYPNLLERSELATIPSQARRLAIPAAAEKVSDATTRNIAFLGSDLLISALANLANSLSANTKLVAKVVERFTGEAGLKDVAFPLSEIADIYGRDGKTFVYDE